MTAEDAVAIALKMKAYQTWLLKQDRHAEARAVMRCMQIVRQCAAADRMDLVRQLAAAQPKAPVVLPPRPAWP